MSVTPFQPVLPPEGPPTDAELGFIEDSPPGLWPTNQDSNFGAKRKVFTDFIQEGIGQLDMIYSERFVATSDTHLDEWEEMLGLPQIPAGRTLAQRRAMVAAAVQVGPYTNARREKLIEEFLSITMGTPILLLPEGVAMDPLGVPLYGEAFSNLKSLYRFYDDFSTYTYKLYINNSNTPDIVAVQRELARITPGGWQFTIDNTVVNPLDYALMVKDYGPQWYVKLSGAAGDHSGFANSGTLNGGPVFFASPGLINASAMKDGAGNGALDFDGVDDYITVPDATQMDVGDTFTLTGIIRPDNVNARTILSKGVNGFHLRISSGGALQLLKQGVGSIAASTTPLVAGTAYKFFVRKVGPKVNIFLNGVDRTGAVTDFTIEDTATALYIGRLSTGGEQYDGIIDELAIFNRFLNDAAMNDFNNTANGVA